MLWCFYNYDSGCLEAHAKKLVVDFKGAAKSCTTFFVFSILEESRESCSYASFKLQLPAIEALMLEHVEVGHVVSTFGKQ